MTFEETDFLMLTKELPMMSSTTTMTQITTQTQTTATSTTVAQPAYDYQAELDRITAEIENSLKAQFNMLFNQMESKIKKLT